MTGAGLTASGKSLPRSLVVPDVGIVGVALVLSLWLVPVGTDVLEGDRVVELLGGGVTIDLEAPVTGRLLRCLVDEDAPVAPGTVLAVFAPAAADD